MCVCVCVCVFVCVCLCVCGDPIVSVLFLNKRKMTLTTAI